MRRRLALHTWTLDATPLAEALRIARAAGWDGVELTGWAPSPEMRDAAVRAIAREASRLGRPVRMIDHLEILDRSARRPA